MAKAATTKKAPAKAKAPAKPRKTVDKANRPSPPDRDGDGKSGGSLPGNQTAAAALGSDEAVLAQEQIAEDGTATIIIAALTAGIRTHQPVGVNGRIRNLKVGVKVQVNADELAALEASHVEYETVSPLGASVPVEEAAVEGSSAASSDQPEEEVTQPESSEGTEGGEQPTEEEEAPGDEGGAGAGAEPQEGTEGAGNSDEGAAS